jgi:spore coat protein CotF
MEVMQNPQEDSEALNAERVNNQHISSDFLLLNTLQSSDHGLALTICR